MDASSHLVGSRELVARAARTLARLGLVDAFGHVSVRVGERMLITPASSLDLVGPEACLEVAIDCQELPPGCPPEGWAHLGIYRLHSEAGAVVRSQPPSTLAVGLLTDSITPLHGQSWWLGDSVPVHPSARLARSAELGSAVAASMGSALALVLRGNGAIARGRTIPEALAATYLVSRLCEVWQAVGGPGDSPDVRELTAEDQRSWKATRDQLMPRLGAHLLSGTPVWPRGPQASADS